MRPNFFDSDSSQSFPDFPFPTRCLNEWEVKVAKVVQLGKHLAPQINGEDKLPVGDAFERFLGDIHQTLSQVNRQLTDIQKAVLVTEQGLLYLPKDRKSGKKKISNFFTKFLPYV